MRFATTLGASLATLAVAVWMMSFSLGSGLFAPPQGVAHASGPAGSGPLSSARHG